MLSYSLFALSYLDSNLDFPILDAQLHMTSLCEHGSSCLASGPLALCDDSFFATSALGDSLFATSALDDSFFATSVLDDSLSTTSALDDSIFATSALGDSLFATAHCCSSSRCSLTPAVSWGATDWGVSALDTPIFPSMIFNVRLSSSLWEESLPLGREC